MAEPQIPPPIRLQAVQEAFAEAIRVPFSFATGRFSFQKEKYPEAAASAIRPRGTPDGRDKLAVYNEQYWYRLLTILQEDFPLLAASLGLWEFNRLATEYLGRHPSRSPYLERLPDHLPAFIRSHPELGHPLYIQIAELDMAYLKAFAAPGEEPLRPERLDQERLEALGESPLHLQSWYCLFEEDWNLMENRVRVSRGSMGKPVFEAGKGYWAVYRRDYIVEWNFLHPIQYGLLKELEKGYGLDEACERIHQSLDASGKERLAADLAGWFAEWTRLGCFRMPFITTPDTPKG